VKAPALIIIDMLNDLLQTLPPAAKQHLAHSTNELIAMVRRRNLPVIWVRQEFAPDLQDAFLEMRNKGIRVTIRGMPGCQIISDLDVGAADTVIVKKRYSAFFGTTLDRTLADIRPDASILAGINTHACIRATAIDAYQRDWDVIVAADCVDSYDRQHHDISLRYMSGKIAAVMTNVEIERRLASGE
jgi:nicotinamidase-related amidase